jgi:methylase of polypeptide subunit release factors
VCEIGETQGPAAVAIAARAGLVEAGVRPDLSGRDRVLVARRRVRER